MINSPRSKPETRRDIFVLERRIFHQNFFSGHARSKQLQNVGHTNAENADAWASATLAWGRLNSFGDFHFVHLLPIIKHRPAQQILLIPRHASLTSARQRQFQAAYHSFAARSRFRRKKLFRTADNSTKSTDRPNNLSSACLNSKY